MSESPQNPSNRPQVYKEAEFTLMCEFIQAGLWRTTNLARVCNVSRETIDDWKKRPEAQEAYQKAAREIVNKRKKVGDPEKIMKEMALEVDVNQLDVTSGGKPLLGGLSVNAIPNNDSNTQTA